MATYTHGQHETVLRSYRQRTVENSAGYLLAQLRPDMTLLDVGCGPGTITAGLAERVAKVTAIDQSAEVLAQLDLPGVQVAVGDAHALDFPDDSFDVVHAHQVLQHVADPVAALREMRRVCRPGGIVAARDVDYATMVWYPEVPALSDWLDLYYRVARHNGGEPDAGRRTPPEVLGPPGRLHRRHLHREHVDLRDPRRTRMVGRLLGRAHPRLTHRRPGTRPGPRHRARTPAHLDRLANLDRQRRRLVRQPAQRDPLPPLNQIRRDPPSTEASRLRRASRCAEGGSGSTRHAWHRGQSASTRLALCRGWSGSAWRRGPVGLARLARCRGWSG